MKPEHRTLVFVGISVGTTLVVGLVVLGVWWFKTTVAKAADTGEVYGTVQWGFTIADAAKGKITNEYERGRGAPTPTTREALHNLDEYYGNPGASTAPKK